jgi:hypothetical protein
MIPFEDLTFLGLIFYIFTFPLMLLDIMINNNYWLPAILSSKFGRDLVQGSLDYQNFMRNLFTHNNKKTNNEVKQNDE